MHGGLLSALRSNGRERAQSAQPHLRLSEDLMAAAAEPISGIAHRLFGKLSTGASIVFRDGEQHRQYAPAALHINYLDSPLPGIPASAREERSTPYQLHGVMVCRPEILKFHTIQVGYLLAALAREVEQVARHQSHPRSTRWMILNLREGAGKGLRMVNAEQARKHVARAVLLRLA